MRSHLMAAVLCVTLVASAHAETFLLKGGGRLYGAIEKEYKGPDKKAWMTVRTSFGRVSFRKGLLKKTLKSETDAKTLYVDEARVSGLTGKAWTSADDGASWTELAWVVDGTQTTDDAEWPKKVRAGERVKTAADSSLDLDLGWGLLALDADTELALAKFEGASARLLRGRVGGRVEHFQEERTFKVETPQATMAVRGTVFAVTAAGASSRFSVLEGSVSVGETLVDAGESLTVTGEKFTTEGLRADEPFLRQTREAFVYPVVDWVYVRGGKFEKGAPNPAFALGNVISGPAHEVEVPSYLMARHEVTNTQFDAHVSWLRRYRSVGLTEDEAEELEDALPWRAHARYLPGATDDAPDLPGAAAVWAVRWSDARGYAEWLGARLPSESEWEFAATEGGERFLTWDVMPERMNEMVWSIYNSGDRVVVPLDESLGFHEHASNDRGEVDPNNSEKQGQAGARLRVRPRPVGQLKPNALGFHDLLGNAEEWTADAPGPYEETPRDGSAHSVASAATRVCRGGSFQDRADSINPHGRRVADADSRRAGIRLVRDVPR